MKKKIIILLNIVILGVLPSCFDLEKVNPNQQNEDTFWVDEDALYQGAVAGYDALQSFGMYGLDAHIFFIGLSDEGTNEYPFEFNALVRFTLDDLNSYLGFWLANYALIGRAYQVISRADEIEGSMVPQLEAEMRFLAALGYYNLVGIFGENIAYVDGIQSAADRPRRADNGEIYALMEEYLQLAIADLPTASQYPESDYGRATKGAAQALLGKVYMQQQKYAQAEEVLAQVVQSGEYQLLDNYADNFRELNIANPEAVFVVNFLHKGPEAETNWSIRFRLFSPAEQQGGFGDIQPTQLMLDIFQEEPDRDGNADPRLDATVFHPGSDKPYYGQPWEWWEPFFINPEINMSFFKYSEQEEVATNPGNVAMDRDGGTDFIIIRYSDVLLLYAEALNENGKTSEAYQYVDMVRERANMQPLSEAKPGLSQAEFLEQIKHERLVELAGECVRFFDLKRWGMYGPQNAVNDPNFETFTVGQDEVAPIPQRELDLNENLIQNPGY